MSLREKQIILPLFFLGLSFLLFNVPAEADPPDSFLPDTLFITSDLVLLLSQDEWQSLTRDHVLVVSPEGRFPAILIVESDRKRTIVRSDQNGKQHPLLTSDQEPAWVPWTLAVVVMGTMVAFFAIRF